MCPGQLDQYPHGYLGVDHCTFGLALSISAKVVHPTDCIVRLLIVQTEPGILS